MTCKGHPHGKGCLILTLSVIMLVQVITPGCTDPGKEVITVSAASSLQQVFDELAREFEISNPGARIELNYASSGTLRTQIEQGAPVDVFVSASEQHMDILQGSGMILERTRREIALNTLVIVVPRSGYNITLKDLEDADRLAIGDPAHVPAGSYAKEAMEAAGVWDAVRDRVVYAANVRQVLDYVSRDEIDAGFVYGSDVNDEVVVSQNIPDSFHSPIIYSIAIVKDSEHPELAGRFIEFVNMNSLTFSKYGFITVEAI